MVKSVLCLVRRLLGENAKNKNPVGRTPRRASRIGGGAADSNKPIGSESRGQALGLRIDQIHCRSIEGTEEKEVLQSEVAGMDEDDRRVVVANTGDYFRGTRKT